MNKVFGPIMARCISLWWIKRSTRKGKSFKISKVLNGFLVVDLRPCGRSDKKSGARVAHCCEKKSGNKKWRHHIKTKPGNFQFGNFCFQKKATLEIALGKGKSTSTLRIFSLKTNTTRKSLSGWGPHHEEESWGKRGLRVYSDICHICYSQQCQYSLYMCWCWCRDTIRIDDIVRNR